MMFRKNVFARMFALMVLLTLNSVVYGAGVVSVKLCGESVRFAAEPIIIDGRTYVEARGIMEKLGYTMEWNSTTRAVKASNEEIAITMTIDDNTVVYQNNSKEYNLYWGAPVKIVNSRTMVPLRALAEVSHLQVSWNDTSKTVILDKIQHNTGIYRATLEDMSSSTLEVKEYCDRIGEDDFTGESLFVQSISSEGALSLVVNNSTEYYIIDQSRINSGDGITWKTVSHSEFAKVVKADQDQLFEIELNNGDVIKVTELYIP